MKWQAACANGCGIISEAPNGNWVEAVARTHVQMNPGHRVVVGVEVVVADKESAPA